MISHPPKITRLIYTCFFISGMAGLIYEVLWIRMLGLIFGHTVYAVTTVLVAFMGGLALGSYLCGRVSDRITDLLKVYGLLEVAIGGYCLLIPWLIAGMQSVYVSVLRSVHLSFTGSTLLQFILALAIFLFPTTLMGATLPILSRFFVKDLGSIGRQVGKLYAFNTFGAVVGTYLAGFELLPVMGMSLTLLFAAVLNMGIGTLAYVSSRSNGSVSPPERITSISTNSIASWDGKHRWLLIGFAVSGAVSMIYEIAWTRALNLVIGSSTYAFSSMLLSFLIGIAVGSAIFARLFRNSAITVVWFAVLQIGIGISAAVCYPFFQQLPEFFVLGFSYSNSYRFILSLQVLISLAVMILPTILIGATFPCAAQLMARDLADVGRDVGRIYAFNTTGAIAGSFIAGFFLIPSIGVDNSIKAGIALNLILGLVYFMVHFQKGIYRTGFGIATVGVGFLIFLLPNWDPFVMSSGVSVYAPNYLQDFRSGSFKDSVREYKLLFYKDGASSTVSVHQDSNNAIFLRVNGKTDASTVLDMHTQLMLGHIPALLHSHMRTAMVIGLGSGMTVGALTQYHPDRIDVVEIEPAVVEASSFFQKENRDALRNPKVHLIMTGGRNFLLTTLQKYDLILSEPSNPWIAGVASLFTVESFTLARKHLNPGGIMAQWFHGYGMAPEDLRMVVASFRRVFPNATLWATNQSDFILIGGLDALKLDLNYVREVYRSNPMLHEDLQHLNLLTPEAILSDFFLDEDELRLFAANAELNTDDRLPLEFSTPRNLYRDTDEINLVAMRQVKKPVSSHILGISVKDLERPEIQYSLALGFENKGMYQEALEHLKSALAANPRYAAALLESGRLKLERARIRDGMEDLRALLKVSPKSAEAHNLLGLAYLKQNNFDFAAKELTVAIQLDDSDSIVYILNLATAYRRAKKYDEAVAQYRLALKQQPQNQRLLGVLGATLNLLDRPDDAAKVLERAVAIDPKDHRLHYQLGEAYLRLGRDQDSQESFETAIALDPDDADPYVGLGEAWLALGDRAKAVNYFRKATSLNQNIATPDI